MNELPVSSSQFAEGFEHLVRTVIAGVASHRFSAEPLKQVVPSDQRTAMASDDIPCDAEEPEDVIGWIWDVTQAPPHR